MAVVLGQVSGPEPSVLVSRLGSARYAEREAAAAALEAMGVAALPALREASESKDAEARSRAAGLIAKIETRALSQASQIRLEVKDRPLDAILEGWGSPMPSRVAWHPDTPDAIRRQRVTIHESAPLPFWSAIDRLCRVAGLHYIPGSPGGDGRQPQFRSFLAPRLITCPRADHGPLRLEMIFISHSRQINLIPNSTNPPVEGIRFGARPRTFGEKEEAFRAHLRILAEPRMLIDRIGDALITEAIDDRGQSLLPTNGPYLHYCGLNCVPAQACIRFVISLKHPDRAGKVIKWFKMTMPVEVVTSNRAEPLVIPLADAVGKTFRHGKTSIQVLAIGPDPAGHQTVTLKLGTDEEMPVRLTPGPKGELVPVASRPIRPEVTPNVIQVLDQQGRQFPWFVGDTKSQRPDSAEVTATLTMWPSGGIPIPVPAGHGVVPVEDRPTAVPTVLYHSKLNRVIIQATFEFTDIPLP
jgi:hypothetical protein